MKDFFISYTGVDQNWAEWIAWQLEDAGFDVVIQAWDFRPGGNFVLDMQKAAMESKRTIAILSPDFLKSANTQPEWAAAFAQDPTGKKSILVPVRVRECELTGLLSQIVYIDLVGHNEKDAIDTLMVGIKNERVKPTNPPGFPGASQTRAFPTLPPFPSESQPTVNAPEDAETMTDFLPHPVATALDAFQQASGKKEKFVALDYLIKNSINYLTAVAVSQYVQDDPDKEKLLTWLRSLAATHLLPSLHTLNQVGEEYQKRAQKPYLYPALFERYLTSVSEGSSIGKAYLTLARLDKTTQKVALDAITPRIFLERLLTFRQLQWESDPYKVEAKLRDKLLPVLGPALAQMLTLFTPFFRYRLRYIERVDRDGDDWVYTMVEFPGVEGKPAILPNPFREQGADKPTFKPNRLYLCSAQDYPLVNLHPLLISHFYELYFLEFMEGEKSISYSHCSLPKRYQPPEYYQFLSTRFEDTGAKPEEDLVDELHKASDELEKAETESRVSEMPLEILFSYLSDDIKAALEIGLGESLRIGQFWLGMEFLLMGLSKLNQSALSQKLAEIGMSAGEFRGALRGLVQVKVKDWRDQRDVRTLGVNALPGLQEVKPQELVKLYGTNEMPKAIITPRLLTVLRETVRQAGEGKVSEQHLLLVTLTHHKSIPVNLLLGLLVQAGQDPRHWMEELSRGKGVDPEQKVPLRPPNLPHSPRSPIATPNAKGMLGQLGRDLTALAQAGELRPAVGESARKAMAQIGLILQQTRANNPVLLGDPGVGKTAIVEGLAWRLANDPQVIEKLAGKRIVDLSPNSLLAGTKYRGDLEDRLQKLLKEVRDAHGEVIVFIDELHTILGGRAEGGLGALSDALKPALSRGEFPCIGATTVGEYRRYIKSDKALARRFTPVWLEEPSPEESTEITLTVAKEHLSPSHGVEYPDDAVKEAVRLAIRYLHDEFLPGKAIKLLDQAGPRVTMGGSLRGAESENYQAGGGVVTVDIVRQIVAERTGIPVTSLGKDEREKLLQLEDKLKERVKGQDEAVSPVAAMVKRARAGLSDPKRPVGVFLFAGPTGVGKTELALALAEALFDTEERYFASRHVRVYGETPNLKIDWFTTWLCWI